MASINLTYKGLTGVRGTLTGFNDALTIDALISAIATDEGLDTNFYQISKEGDPNNTASFIFGDSSASVASLGIVTGDVIICTTNQAGSKEQKQKQKLDIAAVKRSDTYDITQLPTQYDENDVVDNANVGGLVARRPWNTP